MFVGFDRQEKAILYGVTGDIPEYLSRIDNGLDADENMIQFF